MGRDGGFELNVVFVDMDRFMNELVRGIQAVLMGAKPEEVVEELRDERFRRYVDRLLRDKRFLKDVRRLLRELGVGKRNPRYRDCVVLCAAAIARMHREMARFLPPELRKEMGLEF